MKRLIILLVFLFSLTGCYNKYSKHFSLDLAICASYAVPGMFCDDLKGDSFSYDIIEEDSFGRILFRFEAFNCLTEQNESVYVVCQGKDTKYIYFYEDICYQVEANDGVDLTALKENNDWESQLNQKKMSRRESMVTYDIFIIEDHDLEFNAVWDACDKELGALRSESNIISFLDADSEGKGMYLYSVHNGEVNKKYIVIISPEYEVEYIKAPNTIDYETFQRFKEECGWKYGW